MVTLLVSYVLPRKQNNSSFSTQSRNPNYTHLSRNLHGNEFSYSCSGLNKARSVVSFIPSRFLSVFNIVSPWHFFILFYSSCGGVQKKTTRIRLITEALSICGRRHRTNNNDFLTRNLWTYFTSTNEEKFVISESASSYRQCCQKSRKCHSCSSLQLNYTHELSNNIPSKWRPEAGCIPKYAENLNNAGGLRTS